MKRARRSTARATPVPAAVSTTPVSAGDAVAARDHVALALLVCVAFARGLFTPLQRSWDDGRFIIDSPLAHEVSWDHLKSILSKPHFEAYHPLHLLSYWLDVPWFGANAFTVHATSLALWVIAGGFVLSALRAVGLSRASAWIATALCMVHPAQVEAVTWATGRKDILALAFAAAAVVWHMRATRFADKAAWISRVLFLLAALSKTSVAALPLWLIGLDLALQRRSFRSAVLHQLPSLALMTALGGVTVVTWSASQMLRTGPADDATMGWRWCTTLNHQWWTALWPAHNAPMYRAHHWAPPRVWTCMGPTLIVAFTAIAWRMRQRRVALGLIGFAVLLLPASNLLPMVFPLQDRYLSLPLFSLALAFGALIDAAPSPARRSVLAVASIATVCLAARSAQYQDRWRDEVTLWQHAVATQPDAYYGWMKLGETRRDQGDLIGAVRAYTRMVQTEPALEVAHVALFHAKVLLDEHDGQMPPSAPMDLARRFAVGTHNAAQLHQLAQQLIGAGYNEAAAMALDYALTLQPFPPQVLAQNAERFERQGRNQVAAVLRRHQKRSAQQP